MRLFDEVDRVIKHKKEQVCLYKSHTQEKPCYYTNAIAEMFITQYIPAVRFVYHKHNPLILTTVGIAFLEKYLRL